MKKILVLCDDYWHPGEVIVRGLDFLKDTYELDFVMDAKDMLTPEFLETFDMIINAKMNQITNGNTHEWMDPEVSEVQVPELVNYVEKGHGYLALHAGNSWFWDKERDYCEFNGCAFVRHPARCAIKVSTIKEHPITAGITEFMIRDEHYEVDHLGDDIEVLMESTSETGGTQVAAYVHTRGEGRMCSLMPGHIYAVFCVPEYQQLIRQAIAWCLGD